MNKMIQIIAVSPLLVSRAFAAGSMDGMDSQNMGMMNENMGMMNMMMGQMQEHEAETQRDRMKIHK